MVPPDDPGSPDVLREPNVDPPPTDPVETPSDKPVQPPPTPHGREASADARVPRKTGAAGRRHLRLVRSRRPRRRAATCVVGEITLSWRGIAVLQSGDFERPWRTRR